MFTQSIRHHVTIHDAAFDGDLNTVKYLLEIKGIDVNLRESGTEETALHHAAQAGQVEVVEYLWEMGADLYAQSKGGATAFIRAEIAFKCCSEKQIKKAERCYQVMELLLQYENELRQKNPEYYQNKSWLIDFGSRGGYSGSPRSMLKVFAARKFLTPLQQQHVRRLEKLFAEWEQARNNTSCSIVIEDKEVIGDNQSSPRGNESGADSEGEHEALFSTGSQSFLAKRFGSFWQKLSTLLPSCKLSLSMIDEGIEEEQEQLLAKLTNEKKLVKQS